MSYDGVPTAFSGWPKPMKSQGSDGKQSHQPADSVR
jgi:hypothetical protein